MMRLTRASRPARVEKKMAICTEFTLRDLLVHGPVDEQIDLTEEDERYWLKLPKLNVMDLSKDNKGGGNGPPGSSTSNTALLNMNQRLNQMKAQKELTSVQMYSQRMVRLRMTQNQRRQVLPWFGSTVVVPQGLGSSSTPTVPYSTADILYGNEVNGGRGTSNEETRQNSFGESEKSKDMTRQRSKELELHPNNRRPSSKSGRQKSISIDSVTPFDKDGMDTLKNLSSALPPTKPTHHFRPNGIRSSMVKTESLYSSSKTNGANSGRDQDDLVAMGTLWSPNNNSDKPQQIGSSSGALSSSSSQQPPPGGSSGRNNSTSNTNTNSYPSKISSSSSVNNSMSSSNNTLNTQRKYPGNSVRPIVVQNNVSGKKNSNSTKEQEDPKYTDPLIGAPASFQQRIIELGALEGDTVRWERTKRLKKKKADRDS